MPNWNSWTIPVTTPMAKLIRNSRPKNFVSRRYARAISTTLSPVPWNHSRRLLVRTTPRRPLMPRARPSSAAPASHEGSLACSSQWSRGVQGSVVRPAPASPPVWTVPRRKRSGVGPLRTSKNFGLGALPSVVGVLPSVLPAPLSWLRSDLQPATLTASASASTPRARRLVECGLDILSPSPVPAATAPRPRLNAACTDAAMSRACCSVNGGAASPCRGRWRPPLCGRALRWHTC